LEKREQIEHLFNLYLSNKCSPAQVQLLATYFNTGDNAELLKSLIQKELQSPELPPDTSPQTEQKLEELFRKIKGKM
jgi:hypothetical protein